MTCKDLWSSIGSKAGKVYGVLVGIEKSVSQQELTSLLGGDDEHLLMACGWLCREGNLRVSEEEGELRFKLIK